jgi:putative endonuclease
MINFFNQKAKNSRKATGDRAEKIVKNYLEERGYRVLEQNYKTKYAEIDIIAQKQGNLFFVEVRSRTGEDFGSPEETIRGRKSWKLKQNALAYAFFKKYRGPYQIDLACVVFDQNQKPQRVSYFENIIN